MLDIEHPEITRACATGYGRPYTPHKCPVCGQECGWVYTTLGGNPVGCDECILKITVEEYVGDI